MNDSFAGVLEARRGYFNARFAERQIVHPDLDGDAFFRVLTEYVAPVVESAAQANSTATLAVGQTLYDIALDLFAQGLLVPDTRDTLPLIWGELLPPLAPFLVQQPRHIAASVINAAYNISQTPDARPQEWSGVMRAAAPLCADGDTLLRAGQIAAWRAGMAHYRLGALELLKTLDAPLARTIFGLAANTFTPDANTLYTALMADPWYDPRTLAVSPRSLQIVKRVGSFRGFGGNFLSPPRVMCTAEGFVASDGENNFLLMADAFGATLHRTEPRKEISAALPFRLDRSGKVSNATASATFPELTNATSSTANQNTMAVTTELTHSIYLIALA